MEYPQNFRTVSDEVMVMWKSALPESTRCSRTPWPDQLRGSASTVTTSFWNWARSMPLTPFSTSME